MTASPSTPQPAPPLALAALLFVAFATPGCDQLTKDRAAKAEAAAEGDEDEPAKKKKKSKKGGETSDDTSASATTTQPTAAVKEAPGGPPAPGGLVIGPPGAGGPNTITFDPNGPNSLDDKSLKGSPASCTALKACCNGVKGPVALACQMSVAQDGGDCDKVLPKIRSIITELKQQAPGGCM